ncbi:MAG: Peptidyl-prolyl cis-trans isomerase Mip [Formosa sp. Hel1_33_131]|nr:MAG: Peptidyl-prolyl cis-trans isomerase Mip [Formosa sp. Hel1_33_131]
MNYKYSILFICLLILTVVSCEKDENTVAAPPNDRGEQQVIDSISLKSYLSTHYYNSVAVNSLANPRLEDLVITELLDGETLPINTTLLIDDVEQHSTTLLEVDYKYYILKIKPGEGESPNFSDSVRVNYSGSLTNGSVFDSSTTPVVFDLVYVITGWSRVMPEFKTSGSYVSNPDGSVSFDGYGMGAMFLPSGLGYFSTSKTGIPSYSNLVFKFEIMQMEINDHDSDNIPSYMEVSESNEFDLLVDTDENKVFNFNDSDDDGDGTATSDEIQIEPRTNETEQGLQAILDATILLSNQFISPISTLADGTFSANIITLVDDNENGIPNYLDDTYTVPVP